MGVPSSSDMLFALPGPLKDLILYNELVSDGVRGLEDWAEYAWAVP